MSTTPTERQYDRDLPYDLDLANSGNGWLGTWNQIVRAACADILDDGPYGPVQISLERQDDGSMPIITGTLTGLVTYQNILFLRPDTEPAWTSPHLYAIDSIRRFRA